MMVKLAGLTLFTWLIGAALAATIIVAAILLIYLIKDWKQNRLW